MADEQTGSDLGKTSEENQKTMGKEEEMEVETAQDYDKIASSTPPPSQGATAGPAETPASPTATVPPEVTVAQSEAEPALSPNAATTGEKRPGFLKIVKKACKNVLTRISPRKHDKVPFVPEGASAGEPSTAASEVAASGKTKPAKDRRGSLIIDSPTSEGRTLLTEISASSDDCDVPEGARKASVVSSDTAAHISLVSNLDEPSSTKEPDEKAMSADEENEEQSDKELKVPEES